jgi:hypothetical protein
MLYGEMHFPLYLRENGRSILIDTKKREMYWGPLEQEKSFITPNMIVLWDMRSYLETARDALGAYSTIELIASYLSAT